MPLSITMSLRHVLEEDNTTTSPPGSGSGTASLSSSAMRRVRGASSRSRAWRSRRAAWKGAQGGARLVDCVLT